MFVYTVRANSLKFFSILGAAMILLISLIVFIPDYSPMTTNAIAEANAKIKFDKVKTNEDRISFLSQYGWEVDSEPVDEAKITIPSDFDKVLASYNEVQKQQGLDLSKYRGKEVMRYTYTVKNYPNYSGTVYANVIIYKNRVIGGDICSSDVSGFIGTFSFPG